MKKRIIILLSAIVISYFIGIILNNIVNNTPRSITVINENVKYEEKNDDISLVGSKIVLEERVYDSLTLNELTNKINRFLNSTISNQGYFIASYSLEKGVDPYLAVAIMLHETGCKWECSTLVKKCNNVGGQKGNPRCGNGAYKSYNSLEEGIKGFIDNLSKNYYAYGLNTPELINPKYAGSKSWATQVNAYIENIKNN